MKTIQTTPAETLLQRLLHSEKLRSNYQVLVESTTEYTQILIQSFNHEKSLRLSNR